MQDSCCHGNQKKNDILVSNHWTAFKEKRSGTGLIFPIYLFRNLKKLLVRNQWTDFNIIWQGFFMVTVYQDCSSRHDSSKIIAAANGTALTCIFPVYLNRKLKKSSCQKPLVRFQNYLAEMFLW